MILAYIAIFIIIYWLPSFIANHNKKKNKTAIVALNTLTGFTIIGWIASLIWALSKD